MAVAHKGSISMELVLIPVGLYKTTVDNDIHFNQPDKESKARIRYNKYCSHCNKEVGPDDIIKGYEYERDKYVVMTDDDLEKTKQFVPEVFRDEYQARLRDAIMKKIQGQEHLFEDKKISPMLIAQMQEPFNDDGSMI